MDECNVCSFNVINNLNLYPADQKFQKSRYMPNSTKVTLPKFTHILASVTKVSGTKVMQKFRHFECVFNIVNLL